MQLSKSVNKFSIGQKITKRLFLFWRESRLFLFCFGGPVQINILVRDIQITAPDDRLRMLDL
jgi:hypothetical protein